MNIDFKNKQTVALLGVTGVLALVVIIAVAVLMLSPAKSVTIEDFSTKTLEELKAWATSNNITDEQLVVQYEFNDNLEKDIVISQSIAQDKKLGAKDVLTVIVSKGADPDKVITLPDLTNMTLTEIEAFVATNKLMDVTYEYTIDPKIEKDRVIKINITEKDVKRSTMIIITISQGPTNDAGEVILPDFVDYTKAKITNWAKANKITITWKESYSDTIEKDKVISQDPKAGETVKSGSKITITMSLGKPVEMKSLAKMTKAEAAKWLEKNSLKAEYTEAYHKDIASGSVISNSPDSGKVAQGTTVKVKISLGKVKMDNFIDKKKVDVESWIKGINAKEGNIKATYGEVESTKPVGAIVSQNVSSGSYMEPGASVYFEISKGKSVNVENKSGSSEADFKNYISGLGLNLGSRSTAYHDSIAAGSIISNDTGNKVAGASVNYTVSEGVYNAPKFSGTYNDAQNAINAANNKGAGFSLNKAGEEYHATIAAGYLIPDKQTVSGKNVSVVVSKGKEPVPVAVGSWAGKPYIEFTNWLTSNGLKPGAKIEEYNETINAGSIIRNDTGNYFAGSSVNYAVSLGSKFIAITDLRQFVVSGDAEATKAKILGYLTNDQGYPAHLISIKIEKSDVSKGELLDGYSSAGSYDKTADTISVVISNGPQ